MQKKASYDFYLILATVIVLFAISVICIYGMFYFKIAQIQEMEPSLKGAYMGRMNEVIAPFIIMLILLLGICVPKRLLPTSWLNIFSAVLTTVVVTVSVWQDVKTGLLVILGAALCLQVTVLVMAVGGSQKLHFEKSGYWVRVGSSLMHLGLILFVFDLFFYQQKVLHLTLFWITTLSTVMGMLFCFYAEGVVAFIRRLQKRPEGEGRLRPEE